MPTLLEWQALGDYEDMGGAASLRQYLEDILARVPREHLRQMSAVKATDIDPRGMALGVYRQGPQGIWIEIYIDPHVRDAQYAPPRARLWALRLTLAHTLFHEVGHHQTLHLNRRAEPTRKKGQVTQTLEKWAEQYVSRRLQKLLDDWLSPTGLASAPGERSNLLLALDFYQKIGRIALIAAPAAHSPSALPHS